MPALAEYHPLFLISLPLIWIALQRGFKGISVALLALNSGVVLALWLFRFDPAQLGELEVLMIVNCMVGLLMGAVVTERKQGEETLQQSEAKFRSIFDNAAEGIFQSTPEGKFLTANLAMAHILGFSSPEELIRERTDIAQQSYVDPAQREEFKRLMEQQNKISGFEYAVPRKDGSVAWVSETTRAVRDAAGRIVYYGSLNRESR
jgi:PAS domain S-box-containing protein